MRTQIAVILACVLAFAEAQEPASIRFEAVDVYVDSGKQSLAAYQIEFAAETGDVKIVGIEGGEHSAFKEAPYYDPAAMQHERAIIAAFSTGRDLPQGKTRVARIHVQVTGAAAPEYVARLAVAASADEKGIQGTVTVERGGAR